MLSFDVVSIQSIPVGMWENVSLGIKIVGRVKCEGLLAVVAVLFVSQSKSKVALCTSASLDVVKPDSDGHLKVCCTARERSWCAAARRMTVPDA